VVLLVSLTPVASVIAPVSPVHEQVEEWTKQQERIRQDAKQVRRMLGHEKECSDGEEGQEHDGAARPEPARTGQLSVI
jgi:hypothetical protein